MITKIYLSMLVCVTALVAMGVVVSGCGSEEADSRSERHLPYERVITMSPAITEIVFALGQGHRVAGVSDYTTYPPEADDLPRCGGYVNPNFEIILSLSPDLIITHGRPGDFGKFGERYGIDILPMEIDDLESIYDTIRVTGDMLDCESDAQELVERMERRVSEIADAAQAGRPGVETLLVVGRDPSSLREVHVVGPGGFLHDFLVLAGGENIMADLGRQYGSVSKEIVAERNPEVIIELHGEGMMEDEERRRYLRVWQDMSTLPAVKNERIYVIEETFAMLPGPRSVKIAERMAEILWEDR